MDLDLFSKRGFPTFSGGLDISKNNFIYYYMQRKELTYGTLNSNIQVSSLLGN